MEQNRRQADNPQIFPLHAKIYFSPATNSEYKQKAKNAFLEWNFVVFGFLQGVPKKIVHSYSNCLVCSPSLPFQCIYDDYHESGSKVNRYILKWTRRARPVFGRISRIFWLYFCISAEVDGAFLSPRPPERSQD